MPIKLPGNLPYTATQKSVATHFAKVKPTAVRPIFDREEPTKCKGFAFLEFEKYDRMQTCLKLYHHSSFNDGQTPARKVRPS